ncbi:LysR family transcriptional regulator [Rhodoferax koreense]|uniref:LysR family transcriptional regulator n=1 Tax=Rhodoferax koreensis TaxID=1842727 RepID=A0A1P8JY58_9BURK|nr:LysR substrate-binding domain-containing protein [Rhodoferax koreense]APW38692.1 LysR family transcriptional regulator [Rhodoferax koreense]
MDLKQIESFVRVAELGSFTRAATALGIPQPLLSRHVRLLEVELRQNLLLRNGRGATPTEAGRVLLEHGRGILHQVQRAREELGRVRGALEGRVAIGLPPSIAKILTVPLTREFRVRLPLAALSISESLSVAMQDSLVTGRLDIALLYNAVPTPGVELSPLLEEPLYLVQRRRLDAPAEAPGDIAGGISLRELATLPLVIPTRPNAIRMMVESELAAIGCQPVIALEIDGVAAILDLVADGAGSAVLSMNAVVTSGRPTAFITRPIHSPALQSKLSVAVSAQRPTTLTQKAMLELIRQTVQTLLNPAGLPMAHEPADAPKPITR